MDDSSSKLQVGQIWITIDNDLAFQSDCNPPGSIRMYSFILLSEGSRLIIEREIEPADHIFDYRNGIYICTLPSVWRAHCWDSPGVVVSRDLLQHACLQK